MSDPSITIYPLDFFGGNIIRISKTIMSEDSPQERTGSAARDFGGGIQKPTITEEFWLAMARNDRASAEEIVARLGVPPVVALPYSFELIENKEGKVADSEARQQQEASGASTPRGVSVMPDMPTEAVTAWNADVMVALIAVSKAEICGAGVGDREVDFLACVGPVDHPGGTLCGWATHETGGKDAKRRNVLDMSLPDQGGVFAIPVNASRSLVKRPKISPLPSSLETIYPTLSSTKGGMRHLPLSA